MEHLKHKDSFKEIINIFKEGYNAPGKAFIWAKVFNMWAIFALGSVFLIVLLIVSFLFFRGVHTEQEGVDTEAQVLSSHLEDTVAFIDIGRRSLEKRQSLLNVLMQSSLEPTSHSAPQTVLEQKLRTLHSLLLSCIEARQMFVSALAEAKNPLLNPAVSNSFKAIISEGAGTLSFPREHSPLITLQGENAQWSNLCVLCENEIKKAQGQLQSVLN